jgi:hypothetical protein
LIGCFFLQDYVALTEALYSVDIEDKVTSFNLSMNVQHNLSALCNDSLEGQKSSRQWWSW